MDENLNLGKNAEIQQALQQFETESQEEAVKHVEAKVETKSSKMTSWIIKHSVGLIKEEKQAEYVLLAFAIIVIMLSIYLFLRGRPNLEPPPQSVIDKAGGPADFLE